MPSTEPRGAARFFDPTMTPADMFRDRRFYTDGAVPPVLFVGVNAAAGLTLAALAAGAWALLVGAYRVVRKDQAMHAVSGVFGLAIALVLALKTGDAANYFLPSVVTGGAIGVVAIGSVLVGRPLTGAFTRMLDGKSRVFYRLPRVRAAHTLVTLAWAVLFLGRAGLRAFLIAEGRTTELAAQAVVLGYPATALWALASFGFLRWRLRGVEDPEPPVVAEAEAAPGDA